MEELEALIILTHLPFLGPIKIRFLMRHFGSAAAVLNTPLEKIALLPGFGPKIMQSWEKGLSEQGWIKNLQLAEKFHTDIIPFYSPHYPKRLLEISDHPLILYVQGKILPQDQHCIAVVGTRQATVYGLEIALQLSTKLAKAGYTIVSGLARGIDKSAHVGALNGGRTFAVLGSGIANIYPTENIELSRAIQKQGALISEFPMSTPPDRQNFPQRNRIVSGMTLGTIVVEAPEKSGAMQTAERARMQGRPVFALPGRVDHDSFKGNHSLIKEGKAQLIEGIEDILKNFNDCPLPLVFKSTQRTTVPLEKEEEDLLQLMPAQEISVEELALLTQWSISKLNSFLMRLVLKKIVKEYPGKIYKKEFIEKSISR